jgi:hypothetical protein
MLSTVDIDVENLPIDLYITLNSSISIYLMMLSIDGSIVEPVVKGFVETKGTFLLSIFFKHNEDKNVEADSVATFIQDFIAKNR